MIENGRLVIISGPSGSGKTTICRHLMSNPRIRRSVSFTTRKPREGEVDGVDYHFVQKSVFEKLVQEDKFLEYEEYCGSFYGTPREPAQEAIHKGELFILAIDVKGALQVMKKIKEITSIFIMAPDEEVLRQRLKKRVTDSEMDIRKRIELSKSELAYSKHYDYCIVNDKLEVTIEKIKKILGLS